MRIEPFPAVEVPTSRTIFPAVPAEAFPEVRETAPVPVVPVPVPNVTVPETPAPFAAEATIREALEVMLGPRSVIELLFPVTLFDHVY